MTLTATEKTERVEFDADPLLMDASAAPGTRVPFTCMLSPHGGTRTPLAV